MNKVGYLTESGKYFTQEEAVIEAKRCLLCENNHCGENCPIGVNPKEVIRLVADSKIEEAVDLLRENNPIAAICSRVCPYESYCVGGCKNSNLEEPIMIPYIEKFLTECEKDYKWKSENKCNKINKKDKKVAIIGSGPSGLSCSAMLAREGYDVTLIEEREDFGGWLSYGIPPHRLPKHAIRQDLEYLDSLGIKFRNNTKVGKDITIEELRQEGFDALLISTGLNKGRILKVKGFEYEGVMSAVEFLAEAKSKDGNINVGKSAVIIGGGDVAMDCGTTAKLTGYEKVRLVVRNGLEDMTASKKELNYLQFVNVPIFDNFDSVEILGDENNKVCGMTFKGTNDSSMMTIEADTIIFAVGQMSDGINEIAPVELDERGTVITDNFKTNIEDIFATGDIVKGQKTACFATALGKDAAKSIDEYLKTK